MSLLKITRFFLSPELVPQPEWDGSTTTNASDLKLEWSNEPTFQFKVLRVSDDEVLYSTYGYVIVFEDQFLEVKTSMIQNYTIYGLAENAHDFLLGNKYTQTFYAVDAGNTIDGNSYDTHPFYQETRYHNGKPATAHGVYARNALGQEWFLRNHSLTYRTLGGSIDLYSLSGQKDNGSSSALQTIKQYQTGCVGTPAMQMFWTFGFHQSRWGYENISVMESVVQGYKDADIPLECMWNDLDIYVLYRDFTNAPWTFPAVPFRQWIEYLHPRDQYYVPIIDSNTYAPNPENESDAYAPWSRGAELETFVRDPTTGGFYYGDNLARQVVETPMGLLLY